MDNWVSAVDEQIKHVKCKHIIFDLENGIQTICNNSSKDEAVAPTRKQFMTYLNSQSNDYSSMLREYIELIHKFKS